MTDPLGRTFDSAADLYETARPSYPTGLTDDLVALAGLKPGDRLLEIGCATGKAARPPRPTPAGVPDEATEIETSGLFGEIGDPAPARAPFRSAGAAAPARPPARGTPKEMIVLG